MDLTETIVRELARVYNNLLVGAAIMSSGFCE
jgi:hypothetical protein